MSYAILRHGKIKAPTLGAATAHNHRTSAVEKVNIDGTRTPLNQVLKGEGTVQERVAGKLKHLPKVRKDAVVAIELVLSASPEWFDGLTKDRAALHRHPKFRQWANASMEWARAEFGRNIVDVALHMDESSPHMHVLAVPLTRDGRLCAKEVLARSELTRRQDSYAQALAGLGLDRGQSAKETKRRHIKLTEKPQSGGGKASALAAELAQAQAEVARLQTRLERLQAHNMAYSRQITDLEGKLAEALKEADKQARLAAFERDTSKQVAAFQAERRASINRPPSGAESVPVKAENGPVDAFLNEHKGLPRATPEQVKVGRLVASAGQFAVLHVGRGRHVLHEYPSGQVPELDRGQEHSGPEL